MAITDASSPASFLHGVREGLAAPSGTAAVTLLGTTTLVLLLLFLVLDEDRVRDRGLEFVLEEPNDFDAYASVRALQLRAYRGAAPVLVLTGGSTTRDVLISDYLQTELAALGNRDLNIFKLTTSRQTLLDSIAMLDAIPEGSSGVAIIGITVGMFSAFPNATRPSAPGDIDSARYAFRSEAFDGELRRLGYEPRPRRGQYLLDNAPFFLARLHALITNALGGGPEYEERVTRKTSRVKAERWNLLGPRISRRLLDYDEGVEAALAALDRALSRLSTRTDVRPVLVEAPINPRFLGEFHLSSLFESHQSRLGVFASRRQIPYLTLNSLADLREEQFYDWAHVVDEDAIRRCSTLVARGAAPLIPVARR